MSARAGPHQRATPRYDGVEISLSEAVAVGRKLEVDIRAQDRAMRSAARRDAARNVRDAPGPQKRDVYCAVAAMVGISGGTYEAAKMVCVAAERDPARFGRYVEDMDRVGGVWTAYDQVKRVRRGEPHKDGRIKRDAVAIAARREAIVALASRGWRDEDIARSIGQSVESVRSQMAAMDIKTFSARNGKSRGLDANRIVESVITSIAAIDGAVMAVEWGRLDRSQVPGWIARLDQARVAVTRLNSKLKEIK